MRKFAILGVMATGLLVASLAFAQPGAGVNDYSSGFGYWGSPGGGASIGYQAIGADPATNLATGQFDYREASRAGQGQGQHGVIFCLTIDGDQARFQIDMGNDNIWEAHAVDNGDGTGDTFGLDKNASPDLTDCDHDNEDEVQRGIRGDIVVEEGGFAGN